MPKDYRQACPVAKSLEFLGERWTLLIVRDLFSGPKRFHDLLQSLNDVAPGVLSHRLKVLEDHQIVKRRLYSDHPPRGEYALTDRGLELRPVIRALAIWGSRYLHPDTVLVHDRCQTAIEMAYYCPSCNELISAAAARYRAVKKGPGLDAGPSVAARSSSPRLPSRRRGSAHVPAAPALDSTPPKHRRSQATK